jgi:hypothetical protein
MNAKLYGEIEYNPEEDKLKYKDYYIEKQKKKILMMNLDFQKKMEEDRNQIQLMIQENIDSGMSIHDAQIKVYNLL